MPRPPRALSGKELTRTLWSWLRTMEALRIGPDASAQEKDAGMLRGGKRSSCHLAIADGQHPLVGGDALEQDAGLLGVVAGQEAADLVPHGVEDQTGSQLDVAARPLFHEGCRKGSTARMTMACHEHCDAAEAEDDPQNAKFLKMFDSFIDPVWQAPCGEMLARVSTRTAGERSLRPLLWVRAPELSRT